VLLHALLIFHPSREADRLSLAPRASANSAYTFAHPPGPHFVIVRSLWLGRTPEDPNADITRQVGHRAAAHPGAPQRLGDVLDSTNRYPGQIHLDQGLLDRTLPPPEREPPTNSAKDSLRHPGIVTSSGSCGSSGGPVANRMKRISYGGYRFPPTIIQQAIWLYLRFTLSLRDVEDLLAERGITVSYPFGAG
jgi:hypothetical protein